MEQDSRTELELARIDLRVAERLFALEGGMENAGRLLNARNRFENVLEKCRREEMAGFCVVSSALAEYWDSVVSGAQLYQVRQSAARFIAKEKSSDDGWRWPVRVMEAGWAHGSIEDSSGLKQPLPHYFPASIVTRVAELLDGARFRRRHPADGDGSPELIAGWLSHAKMQDSAAFATINLLHSAADIRSLLLAAQEANKLDLFGVSIYAYFSFARSQAEGKPALVATDLLRFVALDMCAEPGAGGRFVAA